MSRYSPESRAPAVKVLGYFLLVTSILAVFTRLCTKLWKFRTIFRDDYFVIASLLLSIGQSAAVFIAVDNGYGEYMATLSDAQIHTIMVSQYSATLLYIASVCFSKLSLVSFVGYLSPSSQDRLFSIGAHVAVGVWAVIGIFASAFQCHPHPWSYLHDTCINREAWFTYLGVSNIVTDLAIVAQAIKIIVGVQTNLQRKATLMAVFFFRLVVTGAIVARIVTIYNTPETADPTRDTWATSVSTQLIQCLSIVTASVPQLIPFLRNLNSSGMELGGMTRHMASSSQGKSTKSKSFLSILGRSRTENRSGHELGSVHKPMNKTFVTTASKTAGSRNDPDISSQSSQAGIIRETRTWAVTTEERATSMENTRDGMGMGRESPLIG